MNNIIVLEDNIDINKLITNILKKEGYNVYSLYNAFDALEDFKKNSIDCIITDLMLPVMSGEEFIKEVRKSSSVHIIVISAKISKSDKIEGLKLGADDYIFKPFIEEEIVLKLKNLLHKKKHNTNQKTYNNHEVIINDRDTNIYINGQQVSLTALEYQMVSLLVKMNNRIVTREQFLDELYDIGDEVFDRVIDVHIRNIRKKINAVYKKTLIKTVYGLGYRWEGKLDE